MLKTRYIPENSQEVTRDNLPVVIYAYTSKTGQPAAIAYIGKSNKPAWHYRFQTEELRQRKIDELFSSVAAHEKTKAERHQAKIEFQHGFKVGDILYTTWGYEQTNADFWQVTAIGKGRSIKIRHLTDSSIETGFMCGSTTPNLGDFDQPERTVITRPSYDPKIHPEGCVHTGLRSGDTNNPKHLTKWNGQPIHTSWYG